MKNNEKSFLHFSDMVSYMPTYKHGEKWRTIVTFNYKQKSKVTRTKREGELWEAEILRSMSETEADRKSKVTFREVLERYRDTVTPTKRGKRWEYVRIEAYLNGGFDVSIPIADVTPEFLGTWRDMRLKSVSGGTVLRDFSLLSAIFEHARKEWKLIKENPVRDVKKPRQPDHRDVVLTWRQIKAIVKALGYSPRQPVRTVSQSVALCFLLALRTGMRAGELCNLTWDKVHDGYCVLPSTKTNPREVPLSSKAVRLVEKARSIHTQSLFLLHSQTLDSLFRKAKTRAKVENITFHDSRHTAATWMARKLHVLDLCRSFGWRDPKYAMIYFNPKAKDIAKLL